MTILDSHIDLTEPTSAMAGALAAAFGLGTDVVPTTEWPVEDGDTVLAVRLTGAADGMVYLALNDDVAQRLAASPDVLRQGVRSAIDALGQSIGEGVRFEAGDAQAASGVPAWVAGITDGGELTALVGLSLSLPDAQPAMPAAPMAGAAAPVAPTAPVAPMASAPAASTNPNFQPEQLAAERPHVSFGSARPLSVLHDVDLVVTAELGRTTMPVRELLDLSPGMVVEIDRAAGAPIDLLVNGRRIATGEVVVIDEEFGVRITEILAGDAS